MMNFKLIMRNKIIQIVQTVKSIVSTRNNILSSKAFQSDVKFHLVYSLWDFSMKTHLSARGQIQMLSLHKLVFVVTEEKMEIML